MVNNYTNVNKTNNHLPLKNIKKIPQDMMMEIRGNHCTLINFVFHTPSNKSRKDVDVTGYDG